MEIIDRESSFGRLWGMLKRSQEEKEFYGSIRPFLDAVNTVLNSNTFLFRHALSAPMPDGDPIALLKQWLAEPEFGRTYFTDAEWNPFFSNEPPMRMYDHDFVSPEFAGDEAVVEVERADYLEFLAEMLHLGPRFHFSPYQQGMPREAAGPPARSFLAECEAFASEDGWRYFIIDPEVWNWLCRDMNRQFDYSFDGFGLGSVSAFFNGDVVFLLLTNGMD